MQLIIPSTASLPLTQDHNSDSEQSHQNYNSLLPTETDQITNKKNYYTVNPTINEKLKRNR